MIWVLIILSGIIGFIMFIWGIRCIFLNKVPILKVFICIIGGFILLMSSIIFGLNKEVEQKIEKAEIMIENGAEIYVDNYKTERDTINLEEYRIEFKDNTIILHNVH